MLSPAVNVPVPPLRSPLHSAGPLAGMSCSLVDDAGWLPPEAYDAPQAGRRYPVLRNLIVPWSSIDDGLAGATLACVDSLETTIWSKSAVSLGSSALTTNLPSWPTRPGT